MLYHRNFEFGPSDADIRSMVEGMKEEHISESPDKAADKGVDQAYEGMAQIMLDFNSALEDLSKPENLALAKASRDAAKEIDPEQFEIMEERLEEAWHQLK